MAPQLIKTGGVFTPAGYYYYGVEAPHELAHWPLFFQWLAGSVVACALIMAITRLLLPRLAPQTWTTMVTAKPHQAIAVPKNVTEWWPAFVTPALVWRDVWSLTSAALTWPQQALHLPPPPGTWAGAGAALGYMVFDCIVMIIWRRELRTSMGGAMFKQIWFHHVFSLVFWPIGLHTSAAAVFICWFLLSEVTNVCLNLRTLLIKLSLTSGTPFLVVNVGFFISFFAARIAPIPFLASVWVKADWSRTTTSTFLGTALTTPLPVMLNCYWFYLACNGVMRMLRPAAKKA